jgi:hypothetical protein
MKAYVLAACVILVVIASGCTGMPGQQLMSSESIYENYKDSVLYINMTCDLILAYPAFDIEYEYDRETDIISLSLLMVGGGEVSTVPWGSEGSGFVADSKVISNSHVTVCEEEVEIYYLQDYLMYLYESAVVYYLNESDIDFLVEYNIHDKAEEIYSDVESQNPDTEYLLIDVEDHIVQEIILHLYDNSYIRDIEEGSILAYYPERGFDHAIELTIVDSGSSFPDADYTIMTADESLPRGVTLGDSDALKMGEDVFVIGYPFSAILYEEVFSDPTITKGIVSSRKTSELGVEYIQIDAATSSGSSGGPVFNKYGQVVGILTAGAGESFNFIFPSRYLRGKV